MNVAVFINTPAQVHFFKHIINGLRGRGHEVVVLSRGYGETGALMGELGIDSYVYAPKSTSKLTKLAYFPLDVLKAWSFLKELGIAVTVGFGVYDSLVAKMLGCRNVVFTDSEPSINIWEFVQYRTTLPFADLVITPACFKDRLGRNHVRVNSFKELAYLHPRYYRPDKGVLKLLGVCEGEKYVVLRFNKFDALHDVSKNGFSLNRVVEILEELSKSYRVFISSERELPHTLDRYRLSVPLRYVHDVLYFSSLLITDTQTMAMEAALLGTPVIRCNSFVGEYDMGVFIELEKRYGLMYNLDSENVLDYANKLLCDHYVKERWGFKKDRLLGENMDINPFLINALEKLVNHD